MSSHGCWESHTPYYIHHYHPLPHNHHNHHYLSSHKSKLTWGVQIIPRLRYRLVMEWNRIDILCSKFNPERISECFTPTLGLGRYVSYPGTDLVERFHIPLFHDLVKCFIPANFQKSLIICVPHIHYDGVSYTRPPHHDCSYF